MANKRILLAEDTEQTRITFGAILRKAGYDVVAVADGREALSKILTLEKETNQADLLITDIRMAGLDGLQLADQLDKLRIRIPILAMTGYGDKDLVVELMRRGCLEYIEKPFEAIELLECVARIFKKVDQLASQKK
jgi:DNA-binding NtrC family response regulator